MQSPSHYLNQHWITISKVLCHSTTVNSMGNTVLHIHPWYEFENYEFKITATSPRDQQVNKYSDNNKNKCILLWVLMMCNLWFPQSDDIFQYGRDLSKYPSTLRVNLSHPQYLALHVVCSVDLLGPLNIDPGCQNSTLDMTYCQTL